jgi:hypothetical protein
LTSEFDDLTLQEYLITLSDSDKELLRGFPLTVDELVDSDEDELDALKVGQGLTKEKQTRRSEIISKIEHLRIFAVLEREGRQHHWYNDGNGNGNRKKSNNNQSNNGRVNQIKPDNNISEQKQL